MKKINLVILLCFFTFLSHAQNWKGICSNDTIYYALKADPIDSDWNGYLRPIWIVNSGASGADSIFYFNRCAHDSTVSGNCIAINEMSWLGDNFLRKPDGTENYFNRNGAAITIKTFANINDVWTMIVDPSGVDFVATVINVDTLTIDGVLDSVKSFSIQAWQSGSPVSSEYNGKVLRLSKQHGFITLLQWEMFPFNSMLMPQIHAKLQSVSNRVDASIESLDFAKLDFNERYAVGNEWIVERTQGYKDYMGMPIGEAFSGQIFTTDDSIMSTNLLAPGQLEVTYQRKLNTTVRDQTFISVGSGTGGYYQFTQTSTNTISTKVDTITQNAAPVYLKYYFASDLFYLFPSIVPNSQSKRCYFLDSVCNYPRIRADSADYPHYFYSGSCWWNDPPLSGFSDYQDEYSGIIGFYEQRRRSYGTSYELTFNYHTTLLYLKTGSCTYHNKFDVTVLGMSDQDDESLSINIWPNPSSDFIYINNVSTTNPIQSIKLYDLSGRILLNLKTDSNKIDLSKFTSGLYILEIATQKGNFVKKIMKQ